jgi:hypothetical protein
VVVPASAAALGSPPPTKLRTDAGAQLGWGSSEWTDRDGDWCVSGASDGTRGYPHKALEAPGGHAWIVFRSPKRPKIVRLRAAREVDGQDRLIDPEPVEAELKPGVAPSGRVRRWRAVFTLGPSPNWYLDLHAGWQPNPVCRGTRDEDLSFHLTVPADPPR